MTASSIQATANEIIQRFEVTNAARDRALTEGRQVIRLSANTVRAVHRGDVAESDQLIGDARQMLASLVDHLADHPSIYWAGYVQDAMKEFAEAAITMAIVRQGPIPGPIELAVEDAPYLNALAEAASELRREVLDALRLGDLARAERLLGAMDDIYSLLVTVDFPDAITGGLRRTTDQLRAVLERTRGDLTMTSTQHRLERSLHEAQRTLAEAGFGTMQERLVAPHRDVDISENE